MKQMIDFIIMIFKRLSMYDVLEHGAYKNTYNYRLTQERFLNLANRYLTELTNDEIYNLYEAVKAKVNDEREILRIRSIDRNTESVIRIFDILVVVSSYLLEERRGMPVCKYENILFWRMASHEIDADLYITSFLAYRDGLRPVPIRNFCWKPVIAHNNIVLKNMLDKQISENHFHLNGSAQFFSLMWINLMNNINSMHYKNILDRIDLHRLNHDGIYSSYNNDSLYLRSIKAAVIRLYLFYRINEDKIDLKTILENEDAEKDFTAKKVFEILRADEYEADILCRGYENYIAALNCYSDNTENFDYASLFVNILDNKNEYFCGERFFMYSMFKIIYSSNSSFYEVYDLFHIYIILKESIRAEFIQNNSVMGFDNFSIYERRKYSLIDNTPIEALYYRSAVLDTLKNQPMIKRLEARITPEISAKKNYLNIKTIDDNVIGAGEEAEKNKDYKEKFFYVIHFIKEKEKYSNLRTDDLCRHNGLRLKVRQQAVALINFRNNYPKTAARIRGIDAANTELGCRPEIFAHAFRVLREHEGKMPLLEEEELPLLGVTYHVGEDFVDITDGLRAIEEALLFFNMRCGDRMGHALVLGTDVKEWYNLKKGKISISQQDYLDNIVWLYFKIIEFRIDVDSSLMPYLENEFRKYFRIVYSDNISLEYIKNVFFDDDNYLAGDYSMFNIHTYYDAWKLRGDDPSHYKSGKYENPEYVDDWNWHSINRLYPEEKSIRKSNAVAFLYHTYHFNHKVKLEGSKCITISVPRTMQNAVELVQNHMQRVIALKGICIETNPSSNCLIGSFGKYSYEKHPILKFYNKDLQPLDAKENKCHQISVCINTDDQSVFGTSLENEYALMARALELYVNEEGKHIYNHTSIYDWLNNIRKMGNDFSFYNYN